MRLGKSEFWERQFNGKPTWKQLAFDVAFGAVGPVGCLIADPVVFQPDGVAMYGVLQDVRLFAYLVSAIGVAALGYWVVARKGSRVLAGVLYGVAVFSLVLGVVMLPISVLGLVVLIGALGFMPFLAAFVFWRNAQRCSLSAPGGQSGPMLTTGLLVMLLVPGAVQAGASFVGNRALVRVLRGADAETAGDVAILRSIRFAVRTDRIVDAYLATGDMVERARLESLYTAITGEGIERRIGDRSD